MRPVVEGALWPDPIAIRSLLLSQRLHLQPSVEHLNAQGSIPQFSVEALHSSVLPRLSCLDLQGPGFHRFKPLTPGLGSELRALV